MNEDTRSRLDRLKLMRPGQVISCPAPKDVPVIVSSKVDRKKAVIKIRCTEGEKKRYKDSAAQEGLTLSAWIIKRLEMDFSERETD